MASQDERATESALEDLLGASTEQSTDSDADFVHVQAEALSDSDSESTELPSQLERPIQREQVDDGAPGSSAAVTRTRRPITRELTHLTYLNTPGLSQEQRNHIRRLREQERRRRQEDRQNRTQERRNQRAAVSAVPMRLRDWSATLAFVGRDIPQIRWQQWNDFVMAQTRGINVAERGGTVGHKHAQAAFTAESTSSRACRAWVIRQLGWDENPPAERFKLVLKEIDGSAGLYESFEAFSGYLQKDRGLYNDWVLERTASVTDDMLQIGALLVLWFRFFRPFVCGSIFLSEQHGTFCGPFLVLRPQYNYYGQEKVIFSKYR